MRKSLEGVANIFDVDDLTLEDYLEYCCAGATGDVDIEALEAEYDSLPVRASMRKSLLKSLGRRKGLKNLYNSVRFDGGRHSRAAGYPCHKDWHGAKVKDYRPWQKAHNFGVSEVARYTQDELEIIAILEAEYLDEQFRAVAIDSIDDIPASFFSITD